MGTWFTVHVSEGLGFGKAYRVSLLVKQLAVASSLSQTPHGGEGLGITPRSMLGLQALCTSAVAFYHASAARQHLN